MTLSLPRSILNQADALEAEAESTSYFDGLTKSFGGMMDSLLPKPEIRAPQFPSIESVLPKLGVQEQPVQGPTMDAEGVPQFSLPDDDSFLGTKPKSEYSGALTTLGGTPEAEALTKPGGVASTAGGSYAPVGADSPVTKETVTQAAAVALQRAGLPAGMAPYIAGIAINEGILQPGTIARDHWSVGGVKAPGSAGVVTVPTREVINGQSVMQTASFGKFNSMQEGMDALAAFVRDSPRFGPVARQAAETGDYSNLIAGFHQKGYATDPNWTQQVNGIASGLSVPTAMPASGSSTSAAFDANSIAQQWAGKPYVFGGSGGRGAGVAPTDCSGFVAQLTGLPAHTDTAYTALENRGAVKVSQEQARPGDIVFYMGAGTGGAITHHMGLYAGPGKVLDMSTANGGGVKVRDIGHAGKFEILRDPTDQSTPPPPQNAKPPEPIVESHIAEQTGGTKPTPEQIDAWSQMSQAFNASTDRIKGLTYEQAQASDRAFTGRGGLAWEDLYAESGATGAYGQDAGAQVSSQTSGLPTTGRDIRGDYAPRAVEPGDFELPGLTPSPAETGNPLKQVGQLLSEVGQKISGLFAPPNPADFAQAGRDIRERQATLTGEGPSIADVVAAEQANPSPSQRAIETISAPLRSMAEGSQRDMATFLELQGRQLQGETLTPEEEAEMARAAISVVGDVSGLQSVGKGVPGVIGATKALPKSPAPSMGIVSRAQADEAVPAMDRYYNGTRGGLLPETPRDTAGPPTGIGGAAGRALGAGIGAGYEESQREGSTPESVVRAGVGGAATSIASSGAGRFLRPGRRPPIGAGIVSRETDAFSPRDPNETYDLRHKVVDIGELVTSHGDDFKPNPRFPSELQPRLRDRAAAAQQVNRIASELNPDALLTDTRSIQTGSPIVGPDNIVESGNGRVMALRQAIKRNPDAANRYREEIAKVAADYGIDPSELQGKRFPVLVRERLSDVDRKAFAREANESSTAVVSGFERSLGDAELLTDDLIQGLTVAENQSIDQALSAPANRGILRAFTQALPQNEAGTMVDAMGNLSGEGVRRVKQALIIKAYGNSVTGQRMARSMIESIDPGVKNVETAIYGSLPSIARVEAVSKRGDLSISTDIAKAADMYARLKQNGISVSDYVSQSSMWDRETTPIQDALIQVFDSNKRSARRIREVLEGYANRAEPQANPSQQDLFGGDLSRASKDEILDAAIRATVGDDIADAAARAADQGLESGRFAQEARDAGPVSPIEGIPEQQAPSSPTPPIREGLDSGESGRVPEVRGQSTATLDAGARPPTGPVRIGSGSLQPELPGSEPSRGLYVGEARKRTQKRLDDAMAKGEPITLSNEEEVARLRLDKFPEEMRPWMAEAAKNADWFREQRRGVVPDVAVQESAAKMWASIDDAIKRGAAGKAYNPEETVALRNLLRGQYEVVQDYARRLSEPLTKPKRDQLVAEQLAEAQKLTALFQVAEGARAEAGRSLRQYREYARSLKDNPEEAGLRYIKARFGSMDGAEKVVATYTQMVQDGASPVELAAFLRNVRPAWMDRLNIIRYGSMLSSTTTHLRNIAGNVINIGQDIGLKPLAVGIDAARAGITGGQRTRYMGEVSEMARGMLEGTSVGLRDMWTTLRTGVNPNEIQTIDNLRGGFASGSGKVDALVESPLRALSAADAFFRGVTLGGHTRAVAFRKASQEGLTGAERAERVQDIMENLHRNLDVLDDASKQSARDILQEDRGAVRAGMQLRESMNGLVPYLGDVMVPFVRTPINILAQGLEMSPAGVVSIIKDARAGRTGEATDTAARAVFGSALMYGAGTLAMNGMMTGGYPEDARTRSTLPPGWQPYSLKLGDRYIQYSNLGPFGIPIATAVVLAEAQRQGKPIASGETVMRLGKYMGDQTFMRGVSDFVKAFNDPTRYGENVVENIGTQFAPFAALGRQIERAMGMAQKDPHGALEALYATYPMTAGSVPDRTDSRGRPIMPNQTGVDAFISPTNISREQPDQVLTVLRKSGIGIGAPPKNLITPDGRSVELTPRQKQQFQQLLYSEIEQNLIDFNDPSEAERAMGRARARARESMLMAVR